MIPLISAIIGAIAAFFLLSIRERRARIRKFRTFLTLHRWSAEDSSNLDNLAIESFYLNTLNSVLEAVADVSEDIPPWNRSRFDMAVSKYRSAASAYRSDFSKMAGARSFNDGTPIPGIASLLSRMEMAMLEMLDSTKGEPLVV